MSKIILVELSKNLKSPRFSYLFLTLLTLSTLFNLSIYNTSLAQSSFYNKLTCSWFSTNCSNNSENTYTQNNNLDNTNNVINTNYTPPSFNPVNFTGLFDADIWTKWVYGQNKEQENKVNIDDVNTKSSESIIKSSDLGIKLGDINPSFTSSKLLSDEEVLSRKNSFKANFEKCQNNNNLPECKSSQNNNQGKDFDNSNFTKLQQQQADRAIGQNSPHYDSSEPISDGVKGPEDRQIQQITRSYSGKDTFNPGGSDAAREAFNANIKSTCTKAKYGMSVGGSCPDMESYQSSFKFTTNRFCELTGKVIVITSGNRSASCNARVGGASNSAHMSGLAMDTAFSGMSEGEKTIAFLYFIRQGFNNVGGYSSAGAIHMDRRNGVNRWGPNYSYNSCSSRLFPNYARIAFGLMGVEPCARDDSALPEKAAAALEKMGKTEFAKRVVNVGV